MNCTIYVMFFFQMSDTATTTITTTNTITTQNTTTNRIKTSTTPLTSNYIIHKNYIAMKRFNKDKNQVEALINFNNVSNIKKSILSKIKRQWNFECIYIYIDDTYSENHTNEYNKKILMETDSLPHFDYTRESQNVSLDMIESWTEIRKKAFIINSPFSPCCFDWDFYELEWILSKFDSQLGFFDADSFFIIPQYPRDILNNAIHPDIVLFYLRKFIKINTIEILHDKFYGLYLFYKDALGQNLLRFWYKETTSPAKNSEELIKQIHTLYHSTSDKHPYKTFLFYKATCFTPSKKKFEISKYILLYLSYYGMYVDEFLSKDRKDSIFRAIRTNMKLNYLLQYVTHADDIVNLLSPIKAKCNKNMVWIGKKHLASLKKENKLLEFLYYNWDNIKRNISLWDYKVMSFNDDQLFYGTSIVTFFPNEWVLNFHKKDYNFPPEVKKYHHKKKL